jgi:hypothetical protein
MLGLNVTGRPEKLLDPSVLLPEACHGVERAAAATVDFSR